MAMPSTRGVPMRPRRGCALAAALAATACVAAVPAAKAHPAASGHAAAKPTIVLVHGAFADGSCWDAVIHRLQRDGYRVVAPANPLRGLRGDSEYIAGVLKSIRGPVVLAGHSYAGAVISGAAVGNANVKALVYIAALVPGQGEVLSVLSDKFHGSELSSAVASFRYTKPGGGTGTDLFIKPDRFRPVFAAGLPKTITAVLAATQRPISASAFDDRAGPAAWKAVPSWALVAGQDKAIAPALQRFEYKRAHSHTVEVNSPHLAMVAQPKAVTDLVLRAARSRASDDAKPAGTSADKGSAAPIVAGAVGAAVIVGAGLGVAVVTRGRRAGRP